MTMSPPDPALLLANRAVAQVDESVEEEANLMPFIHSVTTATRPVASLIVESLRRHGVDRVFCVPGESYLALLDALYDEPSIEVVVCRHESGAGLMALADARLTGRPGVLLVSRGPGASNAALAVHAAEQDAVPLIVIIGQIERRDLRRAAFQEIDYASMFGGVAKSVEEVSVPARSGEAVRRAFAKASAGVPGPAILVLPEDLQTDICDASATSMAPLAPASPSAAAVRTAAKLLAESRRPLVLAGHGLETDRGRSQLLSFAERFRIPVAVSFRRHDVFPNNHPLYAGDMALANPEHQLAAFGTADLVLAVGTRLGDVTTQGYRFPSPVSDGGDQRLIHVLAGEAALGAVFGADLAIQCEAEEFLAQLSAAAEPPQFDQDWAPGLNRIQKELATWTDKQASDGLVFGNVIARLSGALAADAIVCVDAGAFASQAYRQLSFGHSRRLIAPISGSMGLGTPAGVAAALRHRDRQVVVLVGDGGFLMTGNELAAAVPLGLDLKVILSDNSCYGSIRLHQERSYPGRTIGTSLHSPNFAAFAAAFGLNYVLIETHDDLERLAPALVAPGPALIHVRTSLDIAPRC